MQTTKRTLLEANMILCVCLNPAIDTAYEMPVFEAGSVFRVGGRRESAGGKGINVARVAKLAGEEVDVIGFFGGMRGEFIKKQLTKLGIGSRFIDTGQETRVCLNIISSDTGVSTEILEKGPEISDVQVEMFLKKFADIADEYKVITASGSLPKGVQADIYCELAKICRLKGIPFLLDTSGEALVEGIKGKPYFVKPNEHEFEAFGARDVVDALAYLKKHEVELPVVSLGAKGCMYLQNDCIKSLQPHKVEVKNTVGSGDAFVSGCAVALSRGLNSEAVLEIGMAFGASNASLSDTGCIDLNQVETLLER